MQFAAEPDVVAELHAEADRLQNVPREWLDSPQDMCHGLRRVAGRINKLADRIETISPIAKKSGAPARLARITGKPTRGQRRGVEGQIEMAL